MRMVLGACVIAAAMTAAAAELPVKTVILYKHGVGYFERAGELRAGESARLDFQAGDMNDVLKSLTIEDRGGKITGLRYDASEPLEKRLRVEGVKTGRITALDLPGQVQQGLALGILSETEAAQLRDYDRKVMHLINVDDFAPHELGVQAQPGRDARAADLRSA